MITFYPGPSKVYPQVATYLQDAMNEGILSQNHRSLAFMDMLKECITVFKKKQNIPEDYTVYFTSSATECWEIVSQSLVKKHSHHVYNGAFGEKWFEYASKLNKQTTSTKFDFQKHFGINGKLFNEVLPSGAAAAAEDLGGASDLLCFTQNETSNATQITLDFLNYTNHKSLTAIDVTSSLGGIELDWKLGDIWLASVQKCLGLPAGLGVMICSPRAIERAVEIGERNHYNSFLFMHENFQKYQTHYTPNVLSIYLLMRVMQQVPDIQVVSKKTKARISDFYDFVKAKTALKLLIEKQEIRSDTVIAIKGTVEEITALKQKAKENDVILGNGYGEWKDTTFRIANFPAIEDWEFEKLKSILCNI